MGSFLCPDGSLLAVDHCFLFLLGLSECLFSLFDLAHASLSASFALRSLAPESQPYVTTVTMGDLSLKVDCKQQGEKKSK